MTLDSRVYITTRFERHELEIDASLLPEWTLATNLDLARDQQLTQAQVKEALWLWAVMQESYTIEQQATDSV